MSPARSTEEPYTTKLLTTTSEGDSAPPGLVEGEAEFMWSYTNDRIGLESLEDRKPTAWGLVESNCFDQGIRNIQELNERQETSDRGLICNYSLGAYFLLSLFETLGEEATGTALRELYLLSESEERWVTEAEIYSAFLKSTPSGLEEEFLSLYRQIHTPSPTAEDT